eukprot:s8401_g5.t1
MQPRSSALNSRCRAVRRPSCTAPSEGCTRWAHSDEIPRFEVLAWRASWSEMMRELGFCLGWFLDERETGTLHDFAWYPMTESTGTVYV